MKNKESYPLHFQLLNKIKKGWVREHKFHDTRRWRFDFAHTELKIAVEIEGGAWVNGRHNRASGFIKDMEKYNNAVMSGWKVLRYTPDQDGEMFIDVSLLLKEVI